jgi:2-polyprenyl-3-methyl-5-hydroxy-6-metoxy-1,4-benzoquinol methylase
MPDSGSFSAEWDKYHSSHHAHTGRTGAGGLADIEFEANFGSHLPSPPATVLEIGFGEGHTLKRLSSRGFGELHGWDIARECVERATAAGVPGTLKHVNAIDELRLVGKDKFDVILAKDLLEHLPRADVVPFLEGVHAALRPGGVFLARLPNMGSFLAVMLRYDDFTHRLGFTENSLKQVFTLAGFDRGDVAVLNDVLPGWPLLRSGLIGHFFIEKLLGPLVRAFARLLLLSQRKGPPRVDTLRAVVKVTKAGPRPALG